MPRNQSLETTNIFFAAEWKKRPPHLRNLQNLRGFTLANHQGGGEEKGIQVDGSNNWPVYKHPRGGGGGGRESVHRPSNNWPTHYWFCVYLSWPQLDEN